MLAVFEYGFGGTVNSAAAGRELLNLGPRTMKRDTDLALWKHTLTGTWRKSPFGATSGNWKKRTFTLSCKRRNINTIRNLGQYPTVRLSWSEDSEEHGHGYLIFDRASVANMPEFPRIHDTKGDFPADTCRKFNAGAPKYFGVGESPKLCVALKEATMNKKEKVGSGIGFLRLVMTDGNVNEALAVLTSAIALAKEKCQ